MTDEQATAPVDQQAPSEAPAGEPTQDGGEDWQKRMSGLQRSHNEETRVLREQIAALQATAAQTTRQAQDQTSTLSSEAQTYKAQAEQLAQSLEAERRQRIAETREAKYPYAVESLGDVGVVIAMDEAKLAGLNARLAPSGNPRSGLMDSNGAARGGTPVEKPLNKKTTAELKADLARYAPQWAAEVKEAMGS